MAGRFSHDPKFTPNRLFSPVDGLHVCCAKTVAAMAAKPAARTLPTPSWELEIVNGACPTAATRGYGAWGGEKRRRGEAWGHGSLPGGCRLACWERMAAAVTFFLGTIPFLPLTGTHYSNLPLISMCAQICPSAVSCPQRNVLLRCYRPVKQLWPSRKIAKKLKKSEILWDWSYSCAQGACKFSCYLDIPGARGKGKQ